MARTVLVIAHFNEDLRWTERVNAEICIVQKGSKPNCRYDELITSPNVGREPHSYLLYIITHYYNLPETVFFSQGNPFDHYPEFVDEVNRGIDKQFKWMAKDPSKYLVSKPDGSPHDGSMDIHGFHRLFYDGKLPEEYPFLPACLFGVKRNRLQRYSQDTYKKLLREVTKHRNPWAFERLVGHLFGDVEQIRSFT